MTRIDIHAHLAPKSGAFRDLLSTMDALSIERAVVVAGGTVPPAQLAEHLARGGGADVSPDNEGVLELCGLSDGRLIPFFFANPHRAGADYEGRGGSFSGLKLAPTVHGIALNDPRTACLIDQAAAFHHPVYLHCLARPGFDVPDLVTLARAYPAVTFILGHAGTSPIDFRAARIISPVGNVLFETSCGVTEVIRDAISTLGAERVLFGSEYPLQHPRVELVKLECLDLQDEVLERIVRLNAVELLGRKTAS